MRGREVRRALHAGRLVYATAVTAPSPRLPELLRRAGADFVFLDTEHTPLDPEALEPELRRYLEARNEDTILIVNIESVPALEDLDRILAVPGLDAVLVG